MARPRLGEGELALNRAKSVFINCPLDAGYSLLFDALVFATVCCGFLPRSALESGTVSEPRMTRIVHAVLNSKYSIHDLSRCSGEGDEHFARFNMPLELGMAVASRFMDPENEHDWLVLVPQGHTYVRFISDLAAYDPATHDGSPSSVIIAVMPWLATRMDAVVTVTPREVLQLLPVFQTRRRELDLAWGGYPPWPDVILTAVDSCKGTGVTSSGPPLPCQNGSG